MRGNGFTTPVPTPVVRQELTAGEAFDTWNDLAEWVEHLVDRFRLRPREVPPCWYLHGAAVEELTALWGAHQVAYGDEQVASAASDWLRILADARIRLADWMARAGCTATEHRDDPDVTWPTTDQLLAGHIAADTAARRSVSIMVTNLDGAVS